MLFSLYLQKILDMAAPFLMLGLLVLVFWVFCKIIADIFGINKRQD